MAQGCIGKRGQRPSKKKAPGTYCQRRPAPPLTYATAGVAGGSDVVGGGVVGCFRRAFVFGLVVPFALVFPLVFDLVFMVFPFSVASADHGTGAHGNKVLRRSTKKKPPDFTQRPGVSSYFASRERVTGGSWGCPAGLRGIMGIRARLHRPIGPYLASRHTFGFFRLREHQWLRSEGPSSF